MNIPAARHKYLAATALMLAMVPLTGCDKIQEMTGSRPTVTEADLDPVLRDPKVGDRYAGDLAHFSGYIFRDNDGNPMEHSYGLLRVVEVSPQNVVVITENGGGPNPQAARNRLNWDDDQPRWDTNERIPIRRSTFPHLIQDEMILAVRRGTDGPIPNIPAAEAASPRRGSQAAQDAAEAAANAAEEAANAAAQAARAAREAADRH